MGFADLAGLFLIILFIYFAGMTIMYDALRPMLANVFDYFGIVISDSMLSLVVIGIVAFFAIGLIVMAWRRYVPNFS
jgi:uncharacterized membrane protein YjgN (DUF898 family)